MSYEHHQQPDTATYEVEMDESTGTAKQIITAEIIQQPTAEQQKEAAPVVALETDKNDTVEGGDHNKTNEQEEDIIGDIGFGDRSMLMRDGRPHKYPALKQYYEFGAWVGRNRKAICVSCRHQSASSQPERLIRHLKRCPQLSEHDRSIADELLAETMANKKTPGRPPGSSYKRAERSYNDSYTGGDIGSGDEHNSSANNNNESVEGGTPAAVGLKPAKRQRGFADARHRIDEALTRFIMVNRIPLKSISSKEFVEFVRVLNPDYRIPTQSHITNVLIPGLLNII